MPATTLPGRVAGAAVRRPVLALCLALGACILAAIGCAWVRLETQVSALLPHGHPILDRFALIQDRFGVTDLLGFVVEVGDDADDADHAAARALVDALGEQVEEWTWIDPSSGEPSPMILSLRGRPDPARDEALLEQVIPELWLLLDEERLDQLTRLLDPRVIPNRLRRPLAPKRAWHDRDALGMISYCYGPWLEAQQDASSPLRRDGDYLRSADGSCWVLLAQAARPAADAAFTGRIAERLTELLEGQGREAARDGARLHAVGPYLIAARDYRSAWGGAINALLTSLAGVLLIFALAYRSLRLPGLILLALPPACGAALGLAALLLGGSMTMVVLAFAAILIGLGVDFVIHLYNGYLWAMQELRERRGLAETVRLGPRWRALAAVWAVERVGGGIVAAAVTSIGTFLLLLASHYRGLSELGAVCGLGLAITLVQLLVVVPAYLTLAGPQGGRPRSWVAPLAHSLTRHPRRWALALGLVLAAAAGWLATRPEVLLYDRDPRRLRPAADELFEEQMRLATRLGLFTGGHEVLFEGEDPEAVLEAGQAFLQRLEAFQGGDDVVLCEPLDTAAIAAGGSLPSLHVAGLDLPPERLAGRLALATPLGELRIGRIEGDHLLDLGPQPGLPVEPGVLAVGSTVELLPLVSRLDQPMAWLAGPGQQRETIASLRRRLDWAGIDAALATVPENLLQRRAPTLELVERLRERLDSGRILLPAELAEGPLKDLVALAWLEADGKVWLRLSLGLNHRTGQDGLPELHQAIGLPGDGSWLELGPDLRLGSSGFPAIVQVLQEILVADFQRLAVLAAALTVLLLLVCLRRPLAVLQALLALGSGLLLGLALMHLTGMRWNMMNIAVVPLVIGIGIDNGIHFVHALRRTGNHRAGVARCLNETGHPILITALTSVVGFASLALHAYRGVQSVGLTAALGIGACLVTALTLLPLLALAGQRTPPGSSGGSNGRTAV